MKKGNLWRGLTTTTGLLLGISIPITSLLNKWEGQVNLALGIQAPTTEITGDTNYYASDYSRNDEGYLKMKADSEQNEIQTMQEGAVLVKNEDAALPLANSERRVTLFGRATADPVYRGNSGGPSLDTSRLISLKQALENDGFAINETLFEAYANSPTKRSKVAVENTAGNKSDIGEESKGFYTDDLKRSFANDYNDVAIVMFARDAGEGLDLFPSDADGVSQLALHQDEADLLKMIQESGNFKKTILLINSAYPMELDFVNQEEYGIDACLWIGGPGLVGFQGVADLLVGKADPSGHFVDTYASNSLSSPAVQNSFDMGFADSDQKYTIAAEDIYVGYKYYETRYHDQVLGLNNADSSKGVFNSTGNKWNYSQEVSYPFGYGTSYAAFDQSLDNLTWNRETHEVTATVTVTNKGYPENSAYSGKSKAVIQLYVSLPWQQGQAEKSAIQLLDFLKTDALGAGESKTYTLVADDYLFATYDENATNGADESKKGCYVFDKGDYYFAIGNDAHDALNNVLSLKSDATLFDEFGNAVEGNPDNVKKEALSETDNTSYATSRETGEVVSNQLQDIDINYFYDEDQVTYLTREDWETFPIRYDDLPINDKIEAQINDNDYVKPADAPSYDSFLQDQPVTLTLVEMKDVEYDDEKWETFLNQLSITDMTNMIGENFGQPGIEKIGKNKNTNSDGPAGPQGGYQGDTVTGMATVRVNEIVAASTFNKELIASRGSFIAEDCLFGGTTQLWAPGCNIHRTPFSGRNFEYYSEDSIMTYLCSAVQVAAMQEKGCNAAPKHFVGNDQETNRTALCVYSTEQAFRQGSLKGFEGAFTKGGALATMMSFTRVGNHFAYNNPAVNVQILRNEWGFKGVNITDNVASWGTDNPTLACLYNGTDTFNARSKCGSEVKTYLVAQKDGAILQALRTANKHFFYAMSRSSLINGMVAGQEGTDFTPWWKPTIIVLDSVLGIATLSFLAMFLLTTYVFKDKKPEGNRE